jgi:Spy/CpxP family protein refolding chaperone
MKPPGAAAVICPHSPDSTMNTRRLLLPALGALLALAPLSRAQQATAPAAPATETPRQEHKEKMRDHREEMAKELGLSDDQKAKMKDLNQQERQALKAVHDDASLAPDQKKAKAQDIRKNFEGQRNALLTPDQQKKAAELKEKAKEHHEKHRGPKADPQ